MTLVVEFDSLVPREDSLWQLCPVATEELILCLRVDRSVRTPNHAPIWLFHAVFDCVMFIPPDSAELTRERLWKEHSQDVEVVDVVSVALKQGTLARMK